MRVGASAIVIASLHAALFAKFEVTTTSRNRFLEMDTVYDFAAGTLKLSMTSYIEITVDRFAAFNLSQGLPYRELIGCLLSVMDNVERFQS